jgi:hypothetical protein
MEAQETDSFGGESLPGSQQRSVAGAGQTVQRVY